MPGMTLPEYAKGLEKSSIERPLIESFASQSDILQAIPFTGFSGGSYEGYRETDLGMAQFRAINEPATQSRGKIAPFQEVSMPIDTNLDVDKAILRRHGMERRAREESMQIKRQAKLWTDTFIGGDGYSNPKEFSGLKARCTEANGRVIHNSTGSGGAPLSLAKLDQAIINTREPTHIIMPFDMQGPLIAAARTTSIAGFVIQNWDDVGKAKMSYAGLPVLTGYPKDRHGNILPFTEVAYGGGAAQTSSLFVVSLTEEGLHGIQLIDIEVKDYGLLEDGVTYRTNVSWDVGLVDEADYCVTRLDSFTNGTITV